MPLAEHVYVEDIPHEWTTINNLRVHVLSYKSAKSTRRLELIMDQYLSRDTFRNFSLESVLIRVINSLYAQSFVGRRYYLEFAMMANIERTDEALLSAGMGLGLYSQQTCYACVRLLEVWQG